MDSYEAWQEAGRRLAETPGDTFLIGVKEALRAYALTDYLERFIGTHAVYAEEIGVPPEDVPEFLSGLDELRQPPASVVDEELRRQTSTVLAVLVGMKTLPWSGDHLYGDALFDAQVVLRDVLAGKDVPVLERFRCPSTALDRGALARCELQLPHEGHHKVTDPLLKWTDEQSTNPPKPHDADAEELTGHPVRRCEEWVHPGERRGRCGRTAGHDGKHFSDGYGRWS